MPLTAPIRRRGRDDRIVAVHGDVPANESSTGIGVYRRSLLGAAVRRVVPRYSFGESDFGDVIEVYEVEEVPATLS